MVSFECVFCLTFIPLRSEIIECDSVLTFVYFATFVDFLFKFLVIGSAGAGKSCILHHFIENKCKATCQLSIQCFSCLLLYLRSFIMQLLK